MVVAAAGNAGGSADMHQPSAIPGVIAVGASDADDEIANFSNTGQTLSVAAPGVDVLSLRGSDASGLGNEGLVGSQYQRLSGTSMASPHVAGLAALLLSALPGLALDEVRWHMELNADQPGYPGYDNAGGACPLAVARGALVFDGTNYAGFFVAPGPTLADGTRESYGFAAHMAPDGTPLVDEPTGLLLHEAPAIDGQSDMTVAAASRMNSLFVWAERDPVTRTLLTVRGRRVLPTATTPGYPEATIGAIGTQSVPERQDLLLTVRAPAGLDPGTTVLSATGLPPGAIFDAPTGAFRWRPGGPRRAPIRA